MSDSAPNSDTLRVTAAELREVLITAAGIAPERLDGQETTPLVDLGVDSLAVLELQAVANRRYGVEIPDDALEMSVAGLAAFINKHVGATFADGGE
jgi:acyl carrier protein